MRERGSGREMNESVIPIGNLLCGADSSLMVGNSPAKYPPLVT